MGHNVPQFGERASYGPSDVCYRHKNRPTFTLCQRCGNNICPDCQVQSAVGVLCPSCVKETSPGVSRRSKPSRTKIGRAFTDPQIPAVTYTIMILCGLVFLAQLTSDSVTNALWYRPAYSTPMYFEPWRMLTVMFTHSTSSYYHLLGNMFTLWIFGRELERAVGKLNYILLYAMAGWGGSLAVQLWVYVNPETILTPTVGASGAIFGVMGAMFVGLRSVNVNVTSLGVLLAINFAIGLQPGSQISWQAHLGGMLVGAAVMGVLVNFKGPRQRTKRISLLVGLAVLLVALSASYFVVLPLPVA
ncbi:rhomboid family intramembrane serine protease [Leucobacter sp. UCMA 4100]|nr:rhomboid family intramembrane serine protease [Leucobacter sp. UCMA 4100]